MNDAEQHDGRGEQERRQQALVLEEPRSRTRGAARSGGRGSATSTAPRPPHLPAIGFFASAPTDQAS